MQFYIPKTKTYVDIDQGFILGDVQYPPGFIRSITPAEREDLGLQEVVEIGIREPAETHFITEELVGNELRITCIPRPAPSTKELAMKTILELEAQANSPRLIREAALGISESVQILSGIQTLIEVERVKLKG